MSDTNGNGSDPGLLRVFVTGSCEGLPEIVDALRIHGGIELVGLSEDVAEAAAALTGGHLDAVIHATRGSDFPKDAYSAPACTPGSRSTRPSGTRSRGSRG